jgi:hypothetical protein
VSRRTRTAFAALVLVLAATGCRTEDAGTPADAPLEAPQGAAAKGAPEAPSPARTASVQPKVLSGYQAGGAASCFELGSDRRCVARPADATRVACAKIGGEALVCEDCSVLCSQPLK